VKNVVIRVESWTRLNDERLRRGILSEGMRLMCVLVREPERLKGEEGKEEGAVGGGRGLRGEEAKLLNEETVVR
jgi:hypothetical protein